MQAKRLLLTVALALGLGLALALLMALSLSPEVIHTWPVTPAITPNPPVIRPGLRQAGRHRWLVPAG